MPLIPERHRKHVSEELASLENAVRIVVFTQKFECDFCRETRELVQELAELSGEKAAV